MAEDTGGIWERFKRVYEKPITFEKQPTVVPGKEVEVGDRYTFRVNNGHTVLFGRGPGDNSLGLLSSEKKIGGAKLVLSGVKLDGILPRVALDLKTNLQGLPEIALRSRGNIMRVWGQPGLGDFESKTYGPTRGNYLVEADQNFINRSRGNVIVEIDLPNSPYFISLNGEGGGTGGESWGGNLVDKKMWNVAPNKR